MNYDLIVVGGGPGGYVAAIKAAQCGLKTCLFEKEHFGGVCLNKGCIPTKALLKSAETLNLVRNCTALGVEIPQNQVKINMEQLLERKNAVVKQLTGGVQTLLRANGVEIISAQACFIDAHTLEAQGQTYQADNIIIATGSAPTLPHFHIRDGQRLLDSTAALNLTQVPERLVVVGGGVIGLEFASIYRSLGSQVTILEYLDSLIPMFDGELRQAAAKHMQSIGVEVHTSAAVTEIDDTKVIWESQGNSFTIEADAILVATGRKPCLEGYGLDNTGVNYTAKGIVTDLQLRTNVQGVYAVGDVNGRSMLAHTAFREANVAVNTICNKVDAMNYDRIPACIYTTPEIASVGLSEEEAKAKIPQLQISRFPLAANGKALVENETTGFIKVLVNEQYDEIVGVHIMGVHATDMIGGLANLMEAEATTQDVLRTVYPHPSVSEIILEAFHGINGKPIHSL